MVRSFFKPRANLTTTDLNWNFLHTREYQRSLLFALGMAVFWWIVAQLLEGDVVIWGDQITSFMPAGRNIADPYVARNYASVPWTALFLATVAYLPLALAVLIQLCLYFAILTTIVYRFGGNPRTVIIILTSFWGLDSALELNIEWIVCLGLLVPPLWSGLFLVMKPQIAIGYGLSFTLRQMIVGALIAVGVLLLSFVIWGWWVPDMLDAQQGLAERSYNMAPTNLLPLPLSVLIGLWLCWQAWRRKSAFLGVWGWLFLVPYITLYSIFLHFVLFAVVYPRLATLISSVMWLIYGGVLVIYFVGEVL